MRAKNWVKLGIFTLLTSLFAIVIGAQGVAAQDSYDCTTYLRAYFTGSCPGIATGSASAGFTDCGAGQINCNTAVAVNCGVTSGTSLGACTITPPGGCELTTNVVNPENIAGVSGYSCGPGDFHGGNIGSGGSAPGPGQPRGDCLGADCLDSDGPDDDPDDDDDGCEQPANAGFDSGASWSVTNGSISDGWARMSAGGELSQSGITLNEWSVAHAVITGTGTVTITFGSTAYTLTIENQLYYVTPLFAPDSGARTLTVENSAGIAIDWICLDAIELACACPEWGVPEAADSSDWTLTGAQVKDGLIEMPQGSTASRDLTLRYHAALKILSSAGAGVQWGETFSATVAHDEPEVQYVELPYVAGSETRELTLTANDATDIYLLCTSALEDACINPNGKLHSTRGWSLSGTIITPTCGSPITMSTNAEIAQSVYLPAGDYQAYVAARFVQTGGYNEIYYTMTVQIGASEYALDHNVEVWEYGNTFPVQQDVIDFTSTGDDYDLSLTVSSFNPPLDLQLEIYEFCISSAAECTSNCPLDGEFSDRSYFPIAWDGGGVWDAYAAVTQDAAVIQSVYGGITLTFSAFSFEPTAQLRAVLGAQTHYIDIGNQTFTDFSVVFTDTDEIQSFGLYNDGTGAVMVDNICLDDSEPQVATQTPGPTPTFTPIGGGPTATPQPGEDGYCPAPTGVTVTLPLSPLITFSYSATNMISGMRAAIITMTEDLTWSVPVSGALLATPFQYARAIGTRFLLIGTVVTFLLGILGARLFIIIVVFVRNNSSWIVDVLSQLKQLVWPF